MLWNSRRTFFFIKNIFPSYIFICNFLGILSSSYPAQLSSGQQADFSDSRHWHSGFCHCYSRFAIWPIGNWCNSPRIVLEISGSGIRNIDENQLMKLSWINVFLYFKFLLFTQAHDDDSISLGYIYGSCLFRPFGC